MDKGGLVLPWLTPASLHGEGTQHRAPSLSLSRHGREFQAHPGHHAEDSAQDQGLWHLAMAQLTAALKASPTPGDCGAARASQRLRHAGIHPQSLCHPEGEVNPAHSSAGLSCHRSLTLLTLPLLRG